MVSMMQTTGWVISSISNKMIKMKMTLFCCVLFFLLLFGWAYVFMRVMLSFFSVIVIVIGVVGFAVGCCYCCHHRHHYNDHIRSYSSSQADINSKIEFIACIFFSFSLSLLWTKVKQQQQKNRERKEIPFFAMCACFTYYMCRAQYKHIILIIIRHI